jgi:pyruvate dehydrogenase complex dehydrogenase (E1) component
LFPLLQGHAWSGRRAWKTTQRICCTQPDVNARVEADAVNARYKYNSYSRSIDGGYGQNSLKEVALMCSGVILSEVVMAAQLLAA